jgi:hypothetical protein
MKKLFTVIVLLSITCTSNIFGQQTSEINLPDEFFGGWVMKPSDCEITYFINIRNEDNNLQVSGYDWFSNKVMLEKDNDYYVFLIEGLSEGEVFNFKLKMKLDVEGNLVLDNNSYEICCGEPTDSNKLIKCQ